MKSLDNKIVNNVQNIEKKIKNENEKFRTNNRKFSMENETIEHNDKEPNRKSRIVTKRKKPNERKTSQNQNQ